MRILISIDDTDDIDSRGTGEIAEVLAAGLASNGWGRCGPVTRHQLLIHPDIPYTSHNSAMCFPAEIGGQMLEAVTRYCCAALAAESAPGSDPGLCILVPERLIEAAALIEYGLTAKKRVLSKEEAYRTAAAHHVHLSEHGGTGEGVIGALAGAALRLTGNDGRFKGKLQVPSRNGITTVGEILAFGVDVVQDLEGRVLDEGEVVDVGTWVKLVLMDGKSVLLVVPSDKGAAAAWRAADRKIFRDY
jgi:hypothetical protein